MSCDICAICHEEMKEDLYTLPECNHTFHTNCIMTWFRMKQTNNKCPLCNNEGINCISGIDKTHWRAQHLALENYKTLRIQARKKDAPKQLKKMVEKLKKMEKKFKENSKSFKEFKKSKNLDLTVTQIHKKYYDYKRLNWHLKQKIRKQKILIGFQQNVVNIIIPIKKEI